jgi:hypothetical protein
MMPNGFGLSHLDDAAIGATWHALYKEIERLRTDNAKLRAALERVADPLTIKISGIGMERALKIIATLQAIAKAALANEQEGGGTAPPLSGD